MCVIYHAVVWYVCVNHTLNVFFLFSECYICIG